MKIKNKSWSPLIIPVAGREPLFLPARGSIDISMEAFKSAECQRLWKQRAIIVLPEQASIAAYSR